MKYVSIILLILVGISLLFLLNKSQKDQNLSTKVPEAIKQNPEETKDIPKSSEIAKNLDTPWAIAFLPDNSMLVTERTGRVQHIKDSSVNEVATIESVREISEGGLMGIDIHPKFSENSFVYFYYTYRGDGNRTLNRVVRMTLRQTQGKSYQLTDEKIIVDKIPGAPNHNGGRIKFGPDGFLYITTGDAQNPSQAQNKNTLGGKILRVTDEGKAVLGNPFNNLIYSYGHRNPQGISWDTSGNLFENEHGPSGIFPNCCQDEINKIEKGGNYGWPDSVGDKVASGTVSPLLHSGSGIWAPSGNAIVGNSLFFAGLRGQALYEYKISEKKLLEHFKNEFGRLREVILGPDGMIYITTSNRDGRGSPKAEDDKIIRINPSKL